MAQENNVDQSQQTSPPSYDSAVRDGIASTGPFILQGASKGQDMKVPPPPFPGSNGSVSQSQTSLIPSMPPTTVYNYMDPRTHAVVVSLLPPDHPQMVCLQQGGHVVQTQYGILGILAAIFWFPLGIGLCLLDRQVRCKRCGTVIDSGLCH